MQCNILTWSSYSPISIFYIKAIHFLCKIKKKKKINIWLISCSLLLTSKKCVLLLHLLQTLAGGPVLGKLTLFLCGPVLNPGTLTKYILKPENTNEMLGLRDCVCHNLICTIRSLMETRLQECTHNTHTHWLKDQTYEFSSLWMSWDSPIIR